MAGAPGRRSCSFSRGRAFSALEAGRDLLVGFRFRLSGAGEGSAFKRIMRPQGVALPILGCAVWTRLDATRERCEAVRICIGPVGPVPARASAVEDALRAGQPTMPRSKNAIRIAYETIEPRTSKYPCHGRISVLHGRDAAARSLPAGGRARAHRRSQGARCRPGLSGTKRVWLIGCPIR